MVERVKNNSFQRVRPNLSSIAKQLKQEIRNKATSCEESRIAALQETNKDTYNDCGQRIDDINRDVGKVGELLVQGGTLLRR